MIGFQIMKDLAEHLTNAKTIITIVLTSILSLSSAVLFTYSIFYHIFTYPAYKNLEFDLMKILEKLEFDQDDMKKTDILKFGYFCGGYFGHEYAESSENKRKIHIACEKIDGLYQKAIAP